MPVPSYVLITAARNEALHIEKPIESVIAQTVKPKKWIIVDDGSVDRTDEIIADYAFQHPFIHLIRQRRKATDRSRNFAAKVEALRVGYAYLSALDLDYDFLGNVDADVSFPEHYYFALLSKFTDNPGLGIAGGIVHDSQDGKVYLGNYSHSNVHGSIQFFRQRCYDDVGGYLALRMGGEDTVAVITARKLGWQTRTFSDLVVLHHRRAGTEGKNILMAKFREGFRDAVLGSHPLYHTARCTYGLMESPVFFGAMMRFLGYLRGYMGLRGAASVLPPETKGYLRQEQMDKLKAFLHLRP